VGQEDGTIAWFIDTGAFRTGKLCAFDCDTMQPVIITLPMQAPAL